MIAQHPDHAGVPYWKKTAFISTRSEIEECYRSFAELQADEYLWDWEGKFVDEAVIERLYQKYFRFFRKKQLGRDVFLTFRLPHLNTKRDYRIGRALFALKTAQSLAYEIGLNSPPLTEVIIPLVQSPKDLLTIHEAYTQLENLDHTLFKFRLRGMPQVGVIPIFEKVETLFRVRTILQSYLYEYKKRYGKFPDYLRPFSARSDPALNSGMIPATLANKAALTQYREVEEKTGVPVYPIIGPGALPFRGHLTPETLGEFREEYQGVHTLVIQGAFRYDWPLEKVKRTITNMRQIPPGKPATADNSKQLKILCGIFARPYRQTVEQLAAAVNSIASLMPRRRERILHVGLFGYSRGMGKVSLPRAIPFTGALYSLGTPPELIGTGRGLKEAMRLGLLPILEAEYKNLRRDLTKALSYYNDQAVSYLAKENSAWQAVQEDAKIIREYLNGDAYSKHEEHCMLVIKIITALRGKTGTKTLRRYVEKACRLRRSVG